MKTDRRLVTDAEAAEARREIKRWSSLSPTGCIALLDTREELIAALEEIRIAIGQHGIHGDLVGAEEIARAILAQVRGE